MDSVAGGATSTAKLNRYNLAGEEILCKTLLRYGFCFAALGGEYGFEASTRTLRSLATRRLALSSSPAATWARGY